MTNTDASRSPVLLFDRLRWRRVFQVHFILLARSLAPGFVRSEAEANTMFFKLFSSTLYTAHDGHKSRSELISLITEPLGMQHGEQFASVAIVNNDEASSPAANATE